MLKFCYSLTVHDSDTSLQYYFTYYNGDNSEVILTIRSSADGTLIILPVGKLSNSTILVFVHAIDKYDADVSLKN